MTCIFRKASIPKPVALVCYCALFATAANCIVGAGGLGWVHPWSLGLAWVSRVVMVREDSTSAKVVSVGSSHVEWGVIPGVAERDMRASGWNMRFYNSAAGGSTVTDWLPLVRDGLLTKNPPAVLVVGVSVYDFRSDEADEWFRCYLAGPQDVPWLLRSSLDSQAFEACAQSLLRGPRALIQLPLMATRRAAATCERSKETRGGAWRPPDASSGRKFNAAQLAELLEAAKRVGVDTVAPEIRNAQADDVSPDKPHFRRTLEALRQMILAAQAKGVAIVVVADALSVERRRAGTQYRKDYDTVVPFVRQLCQNYGVVFYDVNSSHWAFADDEFWDKAHLGPEGAARYTNMIVENAVIPTLERSGVKRG